MPRLMLTAALVLPALFAGTAAPSLPLSGSALAQEAPPPRPAPEPRDCERRLPQPVA